MPGVSRTYVNPVLPVSCPDPFVLKYCDQYWAYCTGIQDDGRCFGVFSSTNVTYGVSYATSARISGRTPWTQHCDGATTPPILATIPGKVTGPGHNSAVLGPDLLQMFCVYHRWTEDLSARVLAIDRLDWAGDRLLVLGPSYFRPQSFHQFRFRKQGAILHASCEAVPLGEFTVPAGPATVALRATSSDVGFDMVRVTAAT